MYRGELLFFVLIELELEYLVGAEVRHKHKAILCCSVRMECALRAVGMTWCGSLILPSPPTEFTPT